MKLLLRSPAKTVSRPKDSLVLGGDLREDWFFASEELFMGKFNNKIYLSGNRKTVFD